MIISKVAGGARGDAKRQQKMAEEPTTEVPQETMEAEAAVVTTEAAEAAPTTPSEPPKPQEDPHYEVRHAPLRSRSTALAVR